MGDEAKDGEASPVRSEIQHGSRDVELVDLRAAFAVFLGRLPENPGYQIAYWQTRPLAELLRTIGGSDEFAQIRDMLVDGRALIGGQALSRADIRQADAWLRKLAPDQPAGVRTGWADLLLAAATSTQLATMDAPRLPDDAIEALEKIASECRRERESGLEMVAFDPAAFIANPQNRFYRNLRGDIDFDAVIEGSASAPVTLPLFTEGLPALLKPAKLTLGAWIEETQDAALRGSLTHWLWDEPTYRRNCATADGDLDADLPAGALAFLHFLTIGDQLSVSPHPLFCHQAYRLLNQRGLVPDDAGFRHFVTSAPSGGVRTSALFDPDFYLFRQPHVRAEIASGSFGSPLEHFVRKGLAAGYDFSPDFDRHFYLASNPDVGQAISEGRIPSAEWHYIFEGARERRAPNVYFNAWYYSARYPAVAEEMAQLGISSNLEHFLLLGQKRGWLANPPLAERAVAPDDGRALFEKRGRRAYGEIVDGEVAIPSAEAPRLSVVVPVSNQADFTAGFLKSAAFAMETLRSRRGLETEIIVVDSGSRDHTEELLRAVPAVGVVKLETPFSFPAAVNAGASMARGDILLVANNDIEFQPDAFDRAFAILDADLSVGLVGAKVILPNETLQEVGASIDRLGNTEGLGRGIDAFRVVNRRRVTVDYASGCFIAFRRTDYDALSGFDEAFAPGYYEDVDFSLRLKRDLNKTTVIDTGLVVTHYENASFAKGRPAASAMPGALRNRALLKARHAESFRKMAAGKAAARRADTHRVVFGGDRVLVIADRLPAPGLASTSGRLQTVLDAFVELGVAFDIFALRPSRGIDLYKDPRVEVFRGWIPGQSLEDILPLRGGDYSHLWVDGGGALTGHASVLAQARTHFDLTLICDVDELATPSLVGRMELQGGVDDAAVKTALAAELAASPEVDVWVATGDQDRALIESIGIGPVSTLNPVPRPFRAPPVDRPFADRERILFVGQASRANSEVLDGLEWVLSEVWPQARGLGQAKLTLTGEWGEDVAQGLRRRFADRLEMTGPVDRAQLSRIYSESRIALAPDLFAAYRSMQAAETVLAGIPVIMTDIVADRLDLADEEAISRVRRDDGGRSCADWLGRLYTQERTWRSQLKKQRAAIARLVGAEGFVEQVAGVLNVDRPSRRTSATDRPLRS